jgi:hypothetical protein
VSSECFAKVVPRSNILIRYNLIGVVEDEVPAQRIGICEETEKADQEYGSRWTEALQE